MITTDSIHRILLAMGVRPEEPEREPERKTATQKQRNALIIKGH